MPLCFFHLVYFLSSLTHLGQSNDFKLIPQELLLTSPAARLYLLVDGVYDSSLEVNCSLTDFPTTKEKGTVARVRRKASDGHVLPSNSEDIVQEDPTSIYLGMSGSGEQPKVTPETSTERKSTASVELEMTTTERQEDVSENETKVEILFEEDAFNHTTSMLFNTTEKPPLAGVSNEPGQSSQGGSWKLSNAVFTFMQGDLLPVDFEFEPFDACVEGTLSIQCCTADQTRCTESRIDYDLKPVFNASFEDSGPLREWDHALPQYADISPCPCDLNLGACDVNCCCDEDCSNTAKSAFACPSDSPSPEAMRLEKLVAGSKCTTGHNGSLCIDSYTVTYIGDFLSIQPIIRSFWNYTKRVTKSVSKRGGINEDAEFEWSWPHYKMGVPIHTVKRGILEFWKLPHQSVGSSCSNFSPVIFLGDVLSTCVRHITTDFCINDQAFSVASYITRDHNDGLALVSDLTNKTHVVTSKIQYWCIKNLSMYLHMRNGFGLWDDAMITDDSMFMPCYDNTTPVTSPSEDGTCHNVVLEAHYTVFWQSRTLQLLEGNVLLANLTGKGSVGGSSPLIQTTQHFSVVFKHFGTKKAACSDATCYQQDNPPQGSLDDGFFYWQPGADGMCLKELAKASVGENVHTSCWLNVEAENIQDCAKYRKFLCKHHMKLVNSAARYTYMRNASVLILNSNNSCDDDEDMNATNCNLLPTHTVLEVVYADQAVIEGATSVYQILGVRLRFQPKPCIPCIGADDIYCTNPLNGSNMKVELTGDSVPCTPQKRVLLSSSVMFIVADLEAIEPIKEFWRRIFSSCPGGVCWWQLSNVFSEGLYGDQLLADSLQWIVALLAIGVSLLVISCGFSRGIR